MLSGIIVNTGIIVKRGFNICYKPPRSKIIKFASIIGKNMKRTALVAALLLLVTIAAAAAGKANIKFESTSYDFGNIKASGGPVTAVYEFKNTGDAPLVIVNVTNGGCGCTKPDYPKEPVKPGMRGVIKIHFNPAGRRGELNRQVKVKTNGATKTVALTFSGVIIP